MVAGMAAFMMMGGSNFAGLQAVPAYAAVVDGEELVDGLSRDAGYYILSESSKRELSYDDISYLSASEKQMAINEIYARHGRKFRDVELQAYFDQQSWYKGSIEAKDWDEYTLNEIESYNRDFIVKYEKKKGYN